jgi:hypothetical protein
MVIKAPCAQKECSGVEIPVDAPLGPAVLSITSTEQKVLEVTKVYIVGDHTNPAAAEYVAAPLLQCSISF